MVVHLHGVHPPFHFFAVHFQTLAPVASVDATTWYYSLEVIQPEQPNMIGVVIQVNDELAMAESQRPLTRLVEWIIDPSLGLDTKPTTGGNPQ